MDLQQLYIHASFTVALEKMNTSKEAHPICHCADWSYSELPCCVQKRALINRIFYVDFGLTDEDLKGICLPFAIFLLEFIHYVRIYLIVENCVGERSFAKINTPIP